jgi:hypothetical protein
LSARALSVTAMVGDGLMRFIESARKAMTVSAALPGAYPCFAIAFRTANRCTPCLKCSKGRSRVRQEGGPQELPESYVAPGQIWFIGSPHSRGGSHETLGRPRLRDSGLFYFE